MSRRKTRFQGHSSVKELKAKVFSLGILLFDQGRTFMSGLVAVAFFSHTCIWGEDLSRINPHMLFFFYFFFIVEISPRHTVGIACQPSAGLVIERLRVRIPARAAGEFSSPELTLCAESHWVSVPRRVTAVARKRLWSFCQNCR